jgi:hypothetical protein
MEGKGSSCSICGKSEKKIKNHLIGTQKILAKTEGAASGYTPGPHRRLLRGITFCPPGDDEYDPLYDHLQIDD